MGKWSIRQGHIVDIAKAAKEAVWSPFPGVTVVAWQLPNGYTITEQSGCIDPTDYDESIGVAVCRERLTNRVWELEGYVRKNEWKAAQ